MSRSPYFASVSRQPSSIRPNGGRTWWAHFEFTRINIEPIILRKKIEDLRQLAAFMCPGEPRSRTTRER